ncbi:PadR family transcriptional regulator [Microbacterium sp. NPDC056234]|uniref:PadR family transcriptional regulator n=1 Tax=Microbacterium sp. NPDC056234 TaxID=3345757 RepID=UPI0035DDBD4A
MTATRLLLLGAVRERGNAHGYQIRRDLESWGVQLWGNVQQGSIYHGLRKLHGEGLLEQVEAESAESGPARISYSITERGDAAFRDLLENALSSDRVDLTMTIAGIGFMTELTRERALELLHTRVRSYLEWRARVVGQYEREPDADWEHHVEAIRLWAHTADSALDWTRALIGRLESGEYRMAGER